MEGRFCYYIDPTGSQVTEGNQTGFIPSAVYEDKPGHYPMKGDPVKLQAPWIWGPTLKDAEDTARHMNEKLGLSERDAAEIIASSMRA